MPVKRGYQGSAFDQSADDNPSITEQIYGRVAVPDSGRPMWRDGALNVGAFRCLPTGIVIRSGVSVTEKDMTTLAETLRYMQGSLQWLIGDFALTAENLRWGDLPQLAESLGLEYGTLRTYMSVCRNVHLSIRIDKLSFAHHQLVAHRSPDEQRTLLQHALENKLSVAQFRAWLNPKRITASSDNDWKMSMKALDKLLRLAVSGNLSPRQRREMADHVEVLEAIVLKVRSILEQ